MSIYHLRGERTNRINPIGIQAIRVEVMNLGNRDFELLLEGFVRGKKVTQLIQRIPAGSPEPPIIRLKDIATNGRPFYLKLTTNRFTGDNARFMIYARKNGKNVNMFTNVQLLKEPESGPYLP
ncbi:hypothetical protein [Gorillibacterium sp. sgz500922]|uniref:hypothetical protein n=1 Tax=Gorillibacterium sp. sgz500922 TaxID=3446694 RepID=UPI003F664986